MAFAVLWMPPVCRRLFRAVRRLGACIDENDHTIKNFDYGLSGDRSMMLPMKRILLNGSGWKLARNLFRWRLKLTRRCHWVAVLVLIGFLMGTGRSLGAEAGDGSPEERERGMKLAGGDLSVATNEMERFYALGSAARNVLRDGKVEEAEALATELARLAPKHKQDWNYGNAIADSNEVLGQIALSKGDVGEAKKHLLASADSKGSPQLNSFGPRFVLARELAEKGERETVIAYLDSVARFWANPEERTEPNSKRLASENLKELESWKEQLRDGKVPDHPKWR
jgi:hypothetical protein